MPRFLRWQVSFFWGGVLGGATPPPPPPPPSALKVFSASQVRVPNHQSYEWQWVSRILYWNVLHSHEIISYNAQQRGERKEADIIWANWNKVQLATSTRWRNLSLGEYEASNSQKIIINYFYLWQNINSKSFTDVFLWFDLFCCI